MGVTPARERGRKRGGGGGAERERGSRRADRRNRDNKITFQRIGS